MARPWLALLGLGERQEVLYLDLGLWSLVTTETVKSPNHLGVEMRSSYLGQVVMTLLVEVDFFD